MQNVGKLIKINVKLTHLSHICFQVEQTCQRK